MIGKDGEKPSDILQQLPLALAGAAGRFQASVDIAQVASASHVPISFSACCCSEIGEAPFSGARTAILAIASCGEIFSLQNLAFDLRIGSRLLQVPGESSAISRCSSGRL